MINSKAAKLAGEIHLDAKIDAFNDLLSEIQAEGYETVEQVKVSIDSWLSSLEKLKGEQYEREANADHVTEQIPNV